MKMNSVQQEVFDYYTTPESRFVYAGLRGAKHFGYYPNKKPNVSLWKAQEHMSAHLGEVLQPKPGQKILEAGCGEGYNDIYLAVHYNAHFIGVDLLDFHVASAKKKAEKKKFSGKVEFFQMDYSQLDFPDNTFDAVFTMEAFVHSPDYKKGLREFYRVLKPGGKLVMFEYSMAPLDELSSSDRETASLIYTASAMFSMPYFTNNAFPKLLKQAGYKHITVTDITPFVLPALKQVYPFLFLPYALIKLFHLQKYFVNITGTVEPYLAAKKKAWRYNIVVASK